MSDRLDTIPPERLDAETRRLSRLARGLLYGRHDAEDAVQEAWLSVLRPSGEEPRSLRGWLAGTVRRLAGTARRADTRRRHHERSAARRGEEPSAARVAERIEVLRLLIEAVESLNEPYRHTIVWRFLDGLPPREIARREGISANSVRSRVNRGLAMLRQRLDAGREGRREELMATLAPLARLGAGQAVRQFVHPALLTVAALLVGVGGWAWLSGGGPSGEQAVAPTPPLEDLAPEGSLLEPQPEEGNGRVSAQPTLAGERDWVVRGHATLRYSEPFAKGPLIGRLYSGSPADGALLLQERVSTDEDGAFEWALPEPDRFTTVAFDCVLRDHNVSLNATPVPPGDGPPQDLHVAVRPWDVTFYGRVLDPNGKGVAGARLFSYASEALTDAEGRFRLRGSSYSKPSQVTVVADGYRYERLAFATVGPGEIQVDDIVLVAGRRLRGLVIDEDDSPVMGAEIEVWGTETRRKSDDTGHFELTFLDPEEDQQWLRATATGFCAQGRLLTSDELEAGELVWVLERGAAVRGHVREEDGTPVAGAHLYLAYSPNSIPRLECWSDEQGAFEFPAVQAGENTLWALRDGLQSASQPVVVPQSGEPLDGLEVQLVEGHWLGGRVLDEEERPVPWTTVYVRFSNRSLHVESVHADSEGRFRIEGLPAGRVRIGLFRRGFVRHEEVVTTLDRDDLRVQLRRSGALAGRVVDGLTGEPVRSFRVFLVAAATEEKAPATRGYWIGWSGRSSGMPFAGTDGLWTTAGFDDLLPDSATGIRVSAEGYAPTILDRALVSADPDPEALVIELFPASARVRGRVITIEDRAPIPGAMVSAFRSRYKPEDAGPTAQTDLSGTFELEGLPVGGTSLLVEHPEWIAEIEGPFDVPPTGSVERTIELTSGSRLDGRLLDAAGSPLAGEEIALFMDKRAIPGQSHWTGTTGMDGRFSFERLAKGTYRVQWVRTVGRGRTAPYLQRQVVVDGVEAGALELRPKGKSTVRGFLAFEGAPPEFEHVMLLPWPRIAEDPAEDASRTHSTVAIDGHFVFDHIQSGGYLVSALADKASGRAEIQVPEEGEVDVWVEVRSRDE